MNTLIASLVLVIAGLIFYAQNTTTDIEPGAVLEFRIVNTLDRVVEFYSMPDVESFSPRASYGYVTCACMDKCRPSTVSLNPRESWSFRWVLSESCDVVRSGIFVPSVELLDSEDRLYGEKVEFRKRTK